MIHYNRQKTRIRLLRGEYVHWVENSRRARYIRSIILSCPPWVSNWELLALNTWCACLTKFTGIAHEMDHIVPVNHPRVCGLTVPWNLRIIPRKANGAKSNNWLPDQLDLFSEDICTALLFDNVLEPDTIQSPTEVCS